MARSAWLVITALALVATVHLPAAAQSDVAWRYTAPGSIKYTFIDVAGNVLVKTDSVVVAVRPDSGKPIWTLRFASDPRLFRNVLHAYFLFGYGRTALALDPVTGDTVWHRGDLPDLDGASVTTLTEVTSALVQTRQGFAVLDLLTGATRWDSTALPPGTVVREFFTLVKQNLVLLVARTPASEVSVLGVTLDSGRVLWRHDSLFVEKPKFKRERGVENLSDIQWPRILPDSTLFLYFSSDGPLRLDPRSGALHWRGSALAGRKVGGWQEGYPGIWIIDSLVLVASEKAIVALDLATGAPRWRPEREFRDGPTWMVARPAGVLVGGFGRQKQFLTALDPKTGRRSWPRDLEPKAGAYGYIKRDTVYLSNDGMWSRIPLATGKVEELAAIQFEGKEQPTMIDTIAGGFVLAARQNILRVSDDGKVAYRKYYKAPGASFLAKLASTALLVGLNAASYAATPPGGLVTYTTYNPVLSARYGRITEALNYFYIFTETPDSTGREGYSLVLLDRRDGRELGRLWFDERSPNYEIDRVSGMVYEREGREIIARRLR